MNCERCGYYVPTSTIDRRRAMGILDAQCTECRNGKDFDIKYGDLVCRPWRGEVDEELSPILYTGEPYLPGARVCGHSDCVNEGHVISAPTALELERNDISYRTGNLSQLQDYMRELYG